jgi:hypothetical protein
MAGQPYEDPQLPPMTPAGYAPLPSHASWPTVLGIIMIIFGAFGTIGSLFGVFAGKFMALLLTQTGNASAEALQSPLIQKWMQLTSLFSGLGVAVAILLLVAGIGLIKRRTWALKASTVWAGTKITLGVANLLVNYVMQQKIAEAVSAGAIDADAAKLFARGGASLVAMLPGLLWVLALPVFVLIWLSLPNSKEETARWA